ncbi:MAG: hypothetical protein PWP23_9 [Candidatus Sumerlaeota bacterium]|nr:hypothetical protein [Candidatus Sumerlaeota bacterium]
MAHILVAEDESKIALSLAKALEAEGHLASVAADGRQAWQLLSEGEFDLVILDLGLPEMDGIDVLRQARASGQATPILILTARDALEDRVAGLDAGADDYLVKPFALAEVLARVRALLRRGSSDLPRRISVEDLTIDLLQRRAWRSDDLLDLTTKEFEVLALLAQNAGKPVTREMLGKVVWNNIPRVTSLNNVIDVHIARLRRKVDDPFAIPLIHTKRGVGFVLGATPEP